MQEQCCPEIHYQIKNENLVLTGCYGLAGELYLPDSLAGRKITEIAPYAFSDRAEEEADYIWKSSDADFLLERHRICKEEVTAIRLPKEICEIGRYAFYRCRNLRKLILCDKLLDIGGGAFTGCRMKAVEIHFYNGERSCLKSILDEIRFAIRVKLCYQSTDGTIKTAKILFPEHYEEAVENTPARMLETHHHGSGGFYRQCFFNRKLDFNKYDQLFWQAATKEHFDITAELAFSRLMYPLFLLEKHKNEYAGYLAGHIEDTAMYVVKKEGFEEITYLDRNGLWTKNALDMALETAAQMQKTECLSRLMDIKRNIFPSGRKTFEL